MGNKPKKVKIPLTKEQEMANDPSWEKIFKLRLEFKNEEADKLKKEIISKYK